MTVVKSVVMVDTVVKTSVSVTVNITIRVVTYPSHALCWKLIREVGNSWEHAHGLIVMNGFPIVTVQNFH